ncbi:hypothetical protein [Devosia sp.]
MADQNQPETPQTTRSGSMSPTMQIVLLVMFVAALAVLAFAAASVVLVQP